MGNCGGRDSLLGSTPTIVATVAVPSDAELGEGAIWDPRTKRLLWVDLVNAKLFIYDPSTGKNEVKNLKGKFSGSSIVDCLTSIVPFSKEGDPTGKVLGITLR